MMLLITRGGICWLIVVNKYALIRTYVLDTNVLLHSPECINNFRGNNIIIPEVVIEELDNLKTHSGNIGVSARKAARLIDKLREKGNLLEGVQMCGDGILRIETDYYDANLPKAWDVSKPDNRILQVCKGLKEKGYDVCLITQDTIERIKADTLAIRVEDFKNGIKSDNTNEYTGRIELYVSEENLNKFYMDKYINVEDTLYYSEENQKYLVPKLIVNQFILIRSTDNPRKTALGRYNGKCIVPLVYCDSRPMNIVPRNIGQKFMQEALFIDADTAPLVIIKGPAGTAKTLFSLAIGLYKILGINDNQYRRILVCRPNVTMDEQIGFLPGSEQEKISPFMRPIYDNLEILVHSYYKGKYKDEDELNDKMKEMFDKRIITTEAVAYLRGRSIFKNWVIIDEAQNLSPNQIKAIITRIGKGTKLIIIGDPEQIDQPFLGYDYNGLCYAAERMKGSSLCYQVTLNYDECERSDLAYEGSKRL